MAGRGGYQRPSKPAPVSGPGALSKRTDGAPGQGIKSLPGAAYGENKAFEQIQQGAKMAKATPVAKASMPSVTGLAAPSGRPDEPITSGINSGAGVGSEALGLPAAVRGKLADLQDLAEHLPAFERYANTGESSGMMKAFVKYLRSQA